ncbi:muscarinic acetylcholine receptor M2-like [Ptychodera flava]|uniref:muscarinic acetylcholine receptor M2-like n=1 Tax=Ptychodera flava TaxID=63121 RepID=UPI00396A1FE6
MEYSSNSTMTVMDLTTHSISNKMQFTANTTESNYVTTMMSLVTTFFQTDNDIESTTLMSANETFNQTNLNSSTTSSPGRGEPLVAIAIIGAVLSTWIILGNFFVILLFSFHRKLRTISNFFIVNLAVADFLVGILSTPVYTMYSTLAYWPWGHIVCDLWSAIDYTICSVSLFAIIAISVDRYSSLIDPIGHMTKMTKRKARYMIATTWIISIVIYALPNCLWPYFQGYHKVPDGQCYVEYLQVIWFITIQTFLGYLLPLIIQFVLYIKIYQVANKIAKRKSVIRYHDTMRKKNRSADSCKNKTSDPDDMKIAMVAEDSDKFNTMEQKRSTDNRDILSNKAQSCTNLDTDAMVTNTVSMDTINKNINVYENRAFENEIDNTKVSDCIETKETTEGSQADNGTNAFHRQSSITSTDDICEHSCVHEFDSDQTPANELSTNIDSSSYENTGPSSETTNISSEAASKSKEEINIPLQTDEAVKGNSESELRRKNNFADENLKCKDDGRNEDSTENSVNISDIEMQSQTKSCSKSTEEVILNEKNSSQQGQRSSRISRLTGSLSKFSPRRKSKDTTEKQARGDSLNSPGRSTIRSSNARKAFITVSTLLAAFVLCWMPYHVVALINAFCTKCIKSHTFETVYWIYYTNSALNPLCYALANQQFRRAFIRLITKGKLS